MVAILSNSNGDEGSFSGVNVIGVNGLNPAASGFITGISRLLGDLLNSLYEYEFDLLSLCRPLCNFRVTSEVLYSLNNESKSSFGNNGCCDVSRNFLVNLSLEFEMELLLIFTSMIMIKIIEIIILSQASAISGDKLEKQIFFSVVVRGNCNQSGKICEVKTP